MKLLLVSIGLLLFVNTFSQNRKPIVKLCPLALVDEFTFPTVQAGLEIRLSKRISWYNEFGLKYRKGYLERSDTSFIGSRGFKAKTEARYYLLGMQEKRRSANPEKEYYVAVNFFFTRNYSNAELQYYYQGDTAVNKDNYGVKKDVWGTNVLFGTQQVIKGNFVFELYGGVGFRMRQVTTSNKEFVYGKDELITAIDMNICDYNTTTEAKGGNSIVPHLTAGVRLGYKF